MGQEPLKSIIKFVTFIVDKRVNIRDAKVFRKKIIIIKKRDLKNVKRVITPVKDTVALRS